VTNSLDVSAAKPRLGARDRRRSLLTTVLLIGAAALTLAGSGEPPTDGAATTAAREPVHTRGSSAASRKALALKPTLDLGDRFGWRPDAATIVADESGRPWINLEDGRELRPVFAGEEKTLERFESELGEPLGLASADFDEDGIPDLITTYAAETSGGFVTLHIGNPDSIYPHAPEARQRKSAGTFTDDPFLTPALVVPAPVAPFWVGAGDFDADGHKDLVLAARDGTSLHHLPGDGRGGFGAAKEISLSGRITAMTVGEINRRDGLEDVVAAVATDRSFKIVVFEWPEGALRGVPERIPVDDKVTDLTLGQLDHEFLARDLAFVAGGSVSMIRGRDRRLIVSPSRRVGVAKARAETIEFDQTAVALAAGDFTMAPAHELAVLDDDGTVHIVDLVPGDDGDLRTTSPGSVFVGALESTDMTPRLVRGRVSSLPLDDVLVLDRSRRRLHVVPVAGPAHRKDMRSQAEPQPPTALTIDDDPIAVLPMRLNIDALSDLVVLKGAGSPLAVASTKSLSTFTVNMESHAEDYDLSDGRCDTDDNPANGDQCSLYAALRQANENAGHDTIVFSVSTAELGQPRAFEHPVTIDGSSKGRVLITNRGLKLKTGSSTVRNLVFDVNEYGVRVFEGDGGNVIEGCYVGTNTDGTDQNDGGETGGVGIYKSPNNTIGGTAAAARNIIAGNDNDGIDLQDSPEEPVSIGNRILGNYVGTDKTGENRLENFSTGLSLANSPETLVGGVEAGAGNVFSGNRTRGMHLYGSVTGSLIQGNFIGTDAEGTQGVGNGLPDNGYEGIGTNDVRPFTIGGTAATAGNVISGNEGRGIQFFNRGFDGCVVVGNFIGTDVSGLKPLGNKLDGIDPFSANASLLIGGSVTGAGNVIAASGEDGIAGSRGAHEVYGNHIGVGVDGTTFIGNGENGVVANGTPGSPMIIGGIGSGEGNVIAYNTLDGVRFFGRGTVRGNSIHSNLDLGIDRGSFGVDENDDPDDDGVPNFPVLSPEGGTLVATPDTTFSVDLYGNTRCDESGYGEGETWLGDLEVTTDGDGNASFPFSEYGLVTATATGPDGDTSEFSACFDAGEPARTVLIVAPSKIRAADDVQLKIQVGRAGGGTDPSFDGWVDLKLGPGTTTDLAGFRTRTGQIVQQLTAQIEDGVGTVPLITPRQELTTQSVITPQTVLEGTVELVAILDDDTKDTASIEVESPLDLRIDRIEVQQGARSDPPDDMILNRSMLVRVFVNANTHEFSAFKAIEGITVKLHISRGNGQPIPGSPFNLQNAANVVNSTPDKPYVFKHTWTTAERIAGADALNHQLNVREAKLTLRAELDDVYPERDDDNDTANLGPLKFNVSPQLTMLFARTRLDDGSTRTQFPDEATAARAQQFFRKAYPVSNNRFRIVWMPDEVVSGDPLPDTRGKSWWFWLNRTNESNVKGFVHLVDGGFLTGVGMPAGVSGMTNGWGGHVAVVDISHCAHPLWACNTLAHEIGHMHHLGDTYQSGGAHPHTNNPRLPNASSSGNPVQDGTNELYNGAFTAAGSPSRSTDIMGRTRVESWTDQVTWNFLKANLAAGARAKRLAADSALIVRGWIARAGGAGLATCYTLDRSPFDDDAGTGDYVVEALDAGQTVLSSVQIEPDYRVMDAGTILDEYAFGVEMPFSDAIKTVRIRSGSNVIDSIEVSTTDPTVEFTSAPGGTVTGAVDISWQGSDPDGDSLSYSLFYSPDGALKVPLIEETTATSFSWDSERFLSGDAPRLVLAATDGVRSTLVESAVFDVPDRDPEVYISEPADGSRFKRNDAVPLAATVFDPEDGLAAGDGEISWTSNRDGSLGSGESLAAEELSLGSHTITASFTDSAGNSGSDSVTIEVTSGPVCSLSCSPSVLGTAVIGEQINFTAGVSASNCTEPIEHIWDFGDDSAESSSANPSHQYLEAGFHSWQLIATSGTTYCSEVGGIAVSDGMDFTYLIPASAHAAGAEGTNWVTDVVLHDPGDVTALGGLTFNEKDLDNSSSTAEAVLVGSRYSLRLDDVVEDTFGEGSTSGAILVSSSEPLIVSSRTYNDAAGGTFGQYVPGLPESEAIEQGDEVRLIQLTRTDDFRTNIGFASLVSEPINVIVDLYRADGSQIRAKAYSVKPHGYKQVNDIIGKLASGDVEEAYAIVRSNSEGARYFTYASVVDNRSGDPVLILPVSSSAAESGACVPDSWVSLDPGGAFTDDRFYGSFSTGSRHFVVGHPGVIITSTDGTSWTTVPSGSGSLLQAGAWNGSRYVIVGGGGTILTSTNATSWTPIDLGHQRGINDVVWGGGKFVAVGYSGMILTSLNGQTWTTRSSGTTYDLHGVAWNGSTFVVVGDDFEGNGIVLTSGNGVSWTTRTPASGPGWSEKVAWGNGRFVAVGAKGDIATSPDGINWTDRSPDFPNWWDDIIWDGFQFVVVGGSTRILTSPDGVVWTEHDFGPSASIGTVLWTGNRHVVASSSGAIFGSPLCSPSEPLWITAGAHAEGVGGTNWVTDLEIHNPDDSPATVTIDLLPKGINNTYYETEALTIEAGRSRRIADVLDSLFDFTGAAALRVKARGAAVMVGSRTYNDAPAGTFGQFVPGVPESHAVDGGSVRLVQLSRSANLTSGFRTNIGFTNMDGSKISMTVELYDGSGDLLGTTQHNVKPYGQNQITDIFGRVTSGDVANGYAIISSSTAGARFLTYASVVDNRSGDPIYIPAN